LYDAEIGGFFFGHGDGGYRDIGASLHVVLDHGVDVHAVNVIASKDSYHERIGLFHEVDVLVDGVGRALIPGFADGAHLGGHWNNKLRFQQAAELPAFAEMLQERLTTELRQNIDGVDSG